MKAENKQKTAAKARDKKQNRATRRGVVLISVLAVMILIVNIITASFSWFAPNSVTGAGMEYKKTTYNRSEQCTFSTFEGSKLTSEQASQQEGFYADQIVYTVERDYLEVGAGETAYFRTSITNADENYPSDVSLYFASFGESGSNLTIAETSPSNTVRTVSGQQTDFCLTRNAFVKRKDVNDVDGPGLLQVDWFVINNGSSAVTINLAPESDGGSYANMYLMYN
ncbi:MAG: hypothetical protein IJV48_07050 [Ruminococcus sp.]|nr:hypothetical protein [Ruminococcus sp.]